MAKDEDLMMRSGKELSPVSADLSKLCLHSFSGSHSCFLLQSHLGPYKALLSKLSQPFCNSVESLKKTKESTPPQASLLPLVDELDRVARDLRSGGSAEDAEKIEIAAASIRQAASADLTIIDKATSTVTKQVCPESHALNHTTRGNRQMRMSKKGHSLDTP